MAGLFRTKTERHRAAASAAVCWRLCVVCLLLLVRSIAAEAHVATTANEVAAEARGLEIPAITHSDMAYLAPHYRAIIGLAESQTRTDETLRRLLNYTKIQNTYCLWGLFPGAITDEESAFNPCSHAYLAGAWALLQHLAKAPDARGRAAEIIEAFERDRSSSWALVLCLSSVETFNTAQVIAPVPPTVAAGWLLSLVVMASLAAAFVRPVIASARK